ncbi:MAG TPA: glycoside hydrolase family 15 protein, partial [Humisphaera sp.]
FARTAGVASDADAWRIQRAIVRFLEAEWEKPDEGIWEVRGPSRHFTHSKVMAWVAFDRAVKYTERFGYDGDAERWRQARDRIRAQVLAEGFNPAVNAFTQYYGSDEPDASLLVLPLVGFVDARDPRMLGTVDLIRRKLERDGFLDRYVTHEHVDGLPAGEGAFLMCTFWLADNLALQGKRAEATELFERLLSLRNDVGLLSEEYDPVARRLVGNFPQAFSHVGLINTAQRLAQVHGA